MGFGDWGLTKEESERRKREHEEELARIRREGDAEVARIHKEVRESNREHAKYRDWVRRTGCFDVSFDDWKAGRYVHVVISKE